MFICSPQSTDPEIQSKYKYKHKYKYKMCNLKCYASDYLSVSRREVVQEGVRRLIHPIPDKTCFHLQLLKLNIKC